MGCILCGVGVTILLVSAEVSTLCLFDLLVLVAGSIGAFLRFGTLTPNLHLICSWFSTGVVFVIGLLNPISEVRSASTWSWCCWSPLHRTHPIRWLSGDVYPVLARIAERCGELWSAWHPFCLLLRALVTPWGCRFQPSLASSFWVTRDRTCCSTSIRSPRG